MKVPVDQPGLDACEAVTLSRPAAVNVLAAIEFAKHRLGRVDYLDAAHEIMTSALERPVRAALGVAGPASDDPTSRRTC